MIEQLTSLHELAQARHDAAMARMVRHNKKIAEIEQRIATLRQRKRAPYEAPDPSQLSLSLTSGHYDTWHRWIERELASLNSGLAQARAAREDIATEARLSFGRRSATQALLSQHQDDKRADLRKRLEQLFSSG
ncbi:hypothetical protein [Aliiroseovarius sp. 2305UL8-7]|uniref:hypothetical protein n=1 Tax=Aliiroseovarius conchicola TaxID=3121637 RepID=UPI0035298FFC